MSPVRESPIQRACRLIESNLDEFAETTLAHIRSELPGYTIVPAETHRQAVKATAAALLRSLSTGQTVTPSDARAIRYTALRRENAGVPVQDVLAAFHVVGRDVWDALRNTPGIDSATLVELLDPLWTWIQETSAHVAEAFASGSGNVNERQVVLRQRLLESICDGDVADPEAAELARRLDFVPGGEFRAICTEASPWLEGGIDLLQKGLTRLRGLSHAGLYGKLMIVLVQGAEVDAVVSEIRRHLMGREAIGIGLDRPGLSGAETSIGDAERALRVAWPGTTSSFEASWLHASLIDARTRLTPLYGDAKAIAAENPGLADAVRAFANSGFSLASAATVLQVHPNTVAYRLERWHELTGMDTRHFDGLARSMLSIGPPR